MNDAEELAYERGERAAWASLLRTCLHELGYDAEATKQHGWITEREEAIAHLRGLCEEFGDNDWEERLHLADIIERHLGDHLRR